MTRRDLLHVGSLSLLGLSAGMDVRAGTPLASATGGSLTGSFGRAESCILLYLYGPQPA